MKRAAFLAFVLAACGGATTAVDRGASAVPSDTIDASDTSEAGASASIPEASTLDAGCDSGQPNWDLDATTARPWLDLCQVSGPCNSENRCEDGFRCIESWSFEPKPQATEVCVRTTETGEVPAVACPPHFLTSATGTNPPSYGCKFVPPTKRPLADTSRVVASCVESDAGPPTCPEGSTCVYVPADPPAKDCVTGDFRTAFSCAPLRLEVSNTTPPEITCVRVD